MGYTKAQRKAQEEVHAKIMDGYRRGVCDKDGHSEKRNGVFVAKPRHFGYVTFRRVYPREY